MGKTVLNFGKSKDRSLGTSYVQSTRNEEANDILVAEFDPNRFKDPRLDVCKQYLEFCEA